jgi:hypothetical protein
MEGTKSYLVDTTLSQGNKISNDLLNPGGVFNFFYRISWYQSSLFF